MTLTNDCAALAHWLARWDLQDLPAQHDGHLSVTVDERFRLRFRRAGPYLLLQCRIRALPIDGKRAALLENLLRVSAERLYDEPFALAIDPRGEAIWLQAVEPLEVAPEHLSETIDEFVQALESLRAVAREPSHRPAPPTCHTLSLIRGA
ncbi:hypothetical protein PIN31115_04504 [Pandoraea iniqua]|uniref:Uncharacterized protein n=1 Tax=Pandoraea iniqua TaxID=2508288 RepID=A0A5E4YH99_9BURK|nr:CesT family type III secretion system chaperone [Pandoraea iniqua]VVE48121.1 hypothetical protein PIN31115_04504 [Pandoraea iniqua]